jgi:hypothetical protein
MLAGMPDIDSVWGRIRSHQGADFATVTGKPFTYSVTSSELFVTRNGTEINRSLSRGNFELAMNRMPAAGPGELQDLQGPSYTWAILMDSRIRQGDW